VPISAKCGGGTADGDASWRSTTADRASAKRGHGSNASSGSRSGVAIATRVGRPRGGSRPKTRTASRRPSRRPSARRRSRRRMTRCCHRTGRRASGCVNRARVRRARWAASSGGTAGSAWWKSHRSGGASATLKGPVLASVPSPIPSPSARWRARRRTAGDCCGNCHVDSGQRHRTAAALAMATSSGGTARARRGGHGR
jgi:hypothetical protein